MKSIRSVLVLIAILLFAGCTLQRPLVQPLADDTRASCFDVATDGKTVHLLYGAGRENNLDLFWTRRANPSQQWSSPVRIPTSHAPAGNHHRGNDPQIVARGERIMALWTARGGGPYGSGRIATALSNDGGKTWQAGPSPATASIREDIGYRFPATAADDKSFHVVWIHAQDNERSLRYARFDYGADHWTAPRTIDSTACACCWNELKVSDDGKLFVLYRDEEPKDMALAVSTDSGQSWQPMGQVGEFNWQFDGCPHVGGGLAIAPGKNKRDSLFATVWTGAVGRTGAYTLNSDNSGWSWSPRCKLLMAGEVGRHTDAAAISSTHAAVVFDVMTEEEQFVCIATTVDGGKSWEAPKRISVAGTVAKYPRITVDGGDYLVFWSEGQGETVPGLKWQVVSARSMGFERISHRR